MLKLGMSGPFHSLVDAEKRLLYTVTWTTPGQEDDEYIEFLAPLEIEDVTIEGLALRGGCYQHLPDSAIMFQLEMGVPRARTRIPLMRLDWRPLTIPHKNPSKGPAAHRGKLFHGSHLHPFDLNWVEENKAMRAGNLRFAVEVSPEPKTYVEILDFLRKSFKINNVELITEPNWSKRLL